MTTRIARENFNASTRLQRRSTHVLNGRSAERVGRASREPNDDQQPAGRKHHGPQADAQRDAVRRVHEPRQPDRRGGHVGSARGADADAVRPQHAGAVGSRRSDGAAGSPAVVGQHLQVDVRVGRGHLGGDAGPNDPSHPLTGTA